MTSKKLITTKNKSLIEVPYYDIFTKDLNRKTRYFKRYKKNYKITKKIKKLYPNYKGRIDKNVIFNVETDKFFLLNNIYCVLNIESLKEILIKSYPSIEKVLKRNLKEINKKLPALLVAMNFKVSLTSINTQGKETTYIVGSRNEIFTSLSEFFLFYESFMKKYYLDTQYDNIFNEIIIQLIYRYATKKDNKKTSKQNKQ